MNDCLILIPTYNEKENISKILTYTLGLSDRFNILVIDDGSPDGTADIVKSLISNQFNGRLFIEERQGKLGLGTAYIHGFKWALARDYNYIFEMDADFSHNPDDLLRLLAACETKGDMSVGSRYIKGGGVKDWPFIRRFISQGASYYVKAITWIPVNDSTAGFVCYSRKALQSIDLDAIQFVGYAFQIEMKYSIYKAGNRIVEVPIIFKDRELGVSKMNISIFKEALLGVLTMRFNSLFNSKKYLPKP